jgi:predicted  nucleic acid-binding Zn-ribbon protein
LQKTLYALIELQEIDSKLDSLKEERGDLPQVVNNLKDAQNEKQKLLDSQKKSIKDLRLEEKNKTSELESLKTQLKKYEDQLYMVKTNKEYDAIASETENVKKKIDQIETRILEIGDSIEKYGASNEQYKKDLSIIDSELKENDSELQKKIGASAEEENLLLQERQITKKKLTSKQFNSYERIRAAKRGMAVAYCNGGICSGCYTFIPPQRVVEIRAMKKIFTCESCGRILVWNKIEV